MFPNCPSEPSEISRKHHPNPKIRRSLRSQDKMRVYSIPLKDLCDVHDYLWENPIGISIGGVVRWMRVKLVLISILGDIEKQDELCFRFNGKDRANRRCNITHELLNDPFQVCKQILIRQVKKHVQVMHTTDGTANCMIQCVSDAQKSSFKKLNFAATYPSINPFWNAPWVDKTVDSIYQNTPTDYLHCLYLGVFKRIAELIVSGIGSQQSLSELNGVAQNLIYPLRSDGNAPRINFCGGLMNLSKLSGEEIVGFIWSIRAILLTGRYDRLFEKMVSSYLA